MSALQRSAPERYVPPSRANVSCSISSVCSWSRLNFDGRRKSTACTWAARGGVRRLPGGCDGGQQRVDVGLAELAHSATASWPTVRTKTRVRWPRVPRRSGPCAAHLAGPDRDPARPRDSRSPRCCAPDVERRDFATTRRARTCARRRRSRPCSRSRRAPSRSSSLTRWGTAVFANFAGRRVRRSTGRPGLRQHDVRQAGDASPPPSTIAQPMQEPRPSATSTSSSTLASVLRHAHGDALAADGRRRERPHGSSARSRRSRRSARSRRRPARRRPRRPSACPRRPAGSGRVTSSCCPTSSADEQADALSRERTTTALARPGRSSGRPGTCTEVVERQDRCPRSVIACCAADRAHGVVAEPQGLLDAVERQGEGRATPGRAHQQRRQDRERQRQPHRRAAAGARAPR